MGGEVGGNQLSLLLLSKFILRVHIEHNLCGWGCSTNSVVNRLIKRVADDIPKELFSTSAFYRGLPGTHPIIVKIVNKW